MFHETFGVFLVTFVILRSLIVPLFCAHRPTRTTAPLAYSLTGHAYRVAQALPLQPAPNALPFVAQQSPSSGQREARRPRTRRSGPRHPPPHAAPCSAISSCALDPFIATSRPSVRMSGADHLTKRSRGATAREVTASTSPYSAIDRLLFSAATHHDHIVQAEDSTTSERKVVRRNSGSTSTSFRSGLTMASGIPGNPAPLPISTMRSSESNRSETTAQLRIWRSQRRDDSRGPDQPRMTPASANQSW